jgi:hypothetical protein
MPFNATASTFETNEPSLQELLEDIHKGKMQLPDFQRGWVWDDLHIRDLIASVSESFPIGAVMFLETGGDGSSFKPRPVEGVNLPSPVRPRLLILDGQQRLTSLYLALRSGKPVKTRTDKGQEIDRVYYLDMAKCLDPDAERIDAIVSLPTDRVIRSDFGRKVELDVSKPEYEYALGFYPLDIIYDQDKHAVWRRGYGKHFNHEDSKMEVFDQFEGRIVKGFWSYRLPVIELLQSTEKEAVCHVFEKVNTGGVALTVFELVTATFAADNYELRKDWEQRSARIKKHRQLAGLAASDFLTAVTLLATYRRSQQGQGAVSCKRRDILKLTLAEYRQYADMVEQGLYRAAKMLTREKVFDAYTLPYQTQLIPLAAICAVLDKRFESDSVRKMLARWYWCGVFGELYGGANETRYALDIQDVLGWIDGGPDPRTVKDSNFAPTRLLSLQTRNSAAYKGLAAQLMQVGSCDFISGDSVELNTYFDTAVDIHHIFPRAYCEAAGLPRQKWNSVINKAPLSARSNRVIGGNAPSVYLSSIQRNYHVSENRLYYILRSHLIDSARLRADDFHGFLVHRAGALLDLIERATGKSISGRTAEETVKAYGAALVPGVGAELGPGVS